MFLEKQPTFQGVPAWDFYPLLEARGFAIWGVFNNHLKNMLLYYYVVSYPPSGKVCSFIRRHYLGAMTRLELFQCLTARHWNVAAVWFIHLQSWMNFIRQRGEFPAGFSLGNYRIPKVIFGWLFNISSQEKLFIHKLAWKFWLVICFDEACWIRT